jgi:hypothetical protein
VFLTDFLESDVSVLLCQTLLTDEYGALVGMMIVKGIPRFSERNLTRYNFFHHKFYMDCPGIKLGPLL